MSRKSYSISLSEVSHQKYCPNKYAFQYDAYRQLVAHISQHAMLSGGGGCLPGEGVVSSWWGVFLGRGCLPGEGVSSCGCLPGGVFLGGVTKHALRQTPPGNNNRLAPPFGLVPPSGKFSIHSSYFEMKLIQAKSDLTNARWESNIRKLQTIQNSDYHGGNM